MLKSHKSIPIALAAGLGWGVKFACMRFNRGRRVVYSNGPRRLIFLRPTMKPRGKVLWALWRYFLQGIPSFSIMSMPEYLFSAEDTIDKVPPEELTAVMNTMLDIIDAVMYLPNSWINNIDR
ncbi:MAG: hypothetical protein ACJAR0_004575 [Candidatus Azotimanducaceae bacterium]